MNPKASSLGSVGSDRSDNSESSSRPAPAARPAPRSLRVSSIIHDATISFCERFVGGDSRIAEQMVAAAHSGRQNIAAGDRAAGTSRPAELRLLHAARARLDELLLDYEDFLRQRRLRQWTKNDPDALAVRAIRREDPPAGAAGRPAASPYTRWLEHDDPAVVANTIICLIHQTTYLLDQQIRGLERTTSEDGRDGGNPAPARSPQGPRPPLRTEPGTQAHPPPDARSSPECPACGQPMLLRIARQGPRAGSRFWGCPAYPACKGTLPLEE